MQCESLNSCLLDWLLLFCYIMYVFPTPPKKINLWIKSNGNCESIKMENWELWYNSCQNIQNVFLGKTITFQKGIGFVIEKPHYCYFIIY